MKNEDKEAFEKWIDFIEVVWGIDGKKVYVFDRGDMGEAWQAAIAFERKRSEKLLEALNKVLSLNELCNTENEIDEVINQALKDYKENL